MGEALAEAKRRLERARVPFPNREAEFLVAAVLGCTRGALLARRPDPIDDPTRRRLDAAIARRERREPLQYIEGVAEFRGRPFAVDRRVLVPRPETELVVDAALEGLPAGAAVADLGTGSGCIAVSIAVERPDATVLAVDLSADALEVARANARRHDVDDRIAFVHGDLADPPAEWRSRCDLVVSNPPYVAEGEWAGLEPEVRDHEPKLALAPGPTGDEAYPRLAVAAAALLRRGGRLVAELGHTNAAGAERAALEAGLTAVTIRPDPRGIARILIAWLP
ncbi:MAG TPA: peptide chain release factor N(5)-glutamine methyltransferase [Candidatus Polarisedimenticolaceae bacterium]